MEREFADTSTLHLTPSLSCFPFLLSFCATIRSHGGSVWLCVRARAHACPIPWCSTTCSNAGNGPAYRGGRGAHVWGTFYFMTGEQYDVVVGQSGTPGSQGSSSGGGGGGGGGHQKILHAAGMHTNHVIPTHELSAACSMRTQAPSSGTCLQRRIQYLWPGKFRKVPLDRICDASYLTVDVRVT